MFKTISDIIIWSENYKELVKWYEEKLGLVRIGEVDHPEDKAIGFSIGQVELWVGYHDKVKGKNKDKYRIMFNLVVESVSETYTVLSAKGVEFIAKPFKAPTFDKYFATFEDIDGNILQLIGDK
ncbi:MAG: Protein containing Glyoxalase/bleomycin resistance protein/dioxygenase-like protein [Candidatus Gottesmanbacteria bacterium GW2011_GWC2_39_8]|uniref:Protein containing Glyoxalase/bleomycin resistance protein/dioxygenase-like protein n=1 Tax=Candidatus Gottesmanbacteria bacterium GW2011_GWC2_39_8 TaxID=1618450 RepID=A0A0G0PUH4_9BACT|nr:MAG: Protein containing Glyoxalase/bleomycin resistance protein/dioxygenase-like protein [Candidatus Gottesmanbacteria bacterium GW2011_GWC2_39_8]